MWTAPRNYDTNYWQLRSNYISKLGGAPNAWDPLETNKDPLSGTWYGLYENTITRQDQSVRGRVALTAKIADWSNFILEGNLSNIFGKQESKMLGTGRNFDGGAYSLGHSEKNSNFLKWMWTFYNINISKDIKLNGFVGGESQRIFRTYTTGSTSGGLLIPGNYFIANSKNPPSVGGGVSYNKVINSLYASADLEWKNQLYLTGTWRGDWSSALTYADGSGNNFYNYPAASLAWIFTETFKLPKAISFGKLRASLAALGKDTDPFILNPGYYFSGAITGQDGDPSSATYSSSTTLAPNIMPERKIAQEVGIELRFLKNRVGFDVSLYKDNTYNQIIDISTPIESGVSGIKINAGNIQNKGIELTIDGTPVKTRNFTWYSRAIFSRNRNLIVALSDGRTEYPLGGEAAEVSSWAVVGKSYGIIRSTIAAERYNNKENANDPKNGMPILSWRGDARAAFPARSNKWKELGDINAKFRAGWTNEFSYKNWALSVLVDAKVGGDMAITALRFGLHTGALPSTLNGRDAEHGGITWTSKYDGQTYDDGLIVDGVFAPGQKITQPNGTNVEVGGMTFQEAYDKGLVEPTHAPQFYYRYGSSSTGVIDYAIVKSTWVNLRQLALSYRLPQSMCDKIKLNSVTISLIGRDLFYLYNSLPYDINPASLNSTFTSAVGELGVAPMVRSIGGSIKVSF
jgi:iron complex outermembrane receptor protein